MKDRHSFNTQPSQPVQQLLRLVRDANDRGSNDRRGRWSFGRDRRGRCEIGEEEE